MTIRPAVLAIAGALCILAQQQSQEKLAPYYPTPESIVKRMLELGELKAGEKMFDLGSGDGRIVIMAAQKFGADATGVELDNDLWRQSTEKIRKLGLSSKRIGVAAARERCTPASLGRAIFSASDLWHFGKKFKHPA